MDNLIDKAGLPNTPVLDTSSRMFSTRIYRRHQQKIIGVLAVIVFLVVWEMAPALGLVKPYFTSSPLRVLEAAVWLFNNGFWYDVWVSMQEFLQGFALAVVIGVPLGLAMGWFRNLRAAVEPFVIFLYSVPRVALLPLIILWLGIGMESKVAVVFLGAVFPIIISVMSGVRLADETLLKCALSFGATESQLLRKVVLPSTVPFIVTGMRLGASRGLVGIVVGELVASQAGIGHMMSRAGATFQTDKVFVGVILLAVFGLAISQLLKSIEARMELWRPNR